MKHVADMVLGYLRKDHPWMGLAIILMLCLTVLALAAFAAQSPVAAAGLPTVLSVRALVRRFLP